MRPEIAIGIEIDVWPDPQGNPLLIFSEHVTLIYLGCWKESAEPADYVCKLTFEHGWATRTMSTEFLPYDTRGVGTSPVYEVSGSSYLKQVTEWRLRCYPRWKEWDKNDYHHFLIAGHDDYADVIARGFVVERVPCDDVKHLLPLLYQDDVYGLNDDA